MRYTRKAEILATNLFIVFPGRMQLNQLAPNSFFSSSFMSLIFFKLISFRVFGNTWSLRKPNSSLHCLAGRPFLTLTFSVARAGPWGLWYFLHISRICKLSWSPSLSFSSPAWLTWELIKIIINNNNNNNNDNNDDDDDDDDDDN